MAQQPIWFKQAITWPLIYDKIRAKILKVTNSSIQNIDGTLMVEMLNKLGSHYKIIPVIKVRIPLSWKLVQLQGEKFGWLN